jgi:hypothetical protein
VWYVVLDDKTFGLFVFEGRLAEELYLLVLQQELPQLVEDVPLSKRDSGYFENGGASLHFWLEVRNLIDDPFGCRVCSRQPFAVQVFRLWFTGLFVGMDESNDLRPEGCNREMRLLGRTVDTRTKSGLVSGG